MTHETCSHNNSPKQLLRRKPVQGPSVTSWKPVKSFSLHLCTPHEWEVNPQQVLYCPQTWAHSHTPLYIIMLVMNLFIHTTYLLSIHTTYLLSIHTTYLAEIEVVALGTLVSMATERGLTLSMCSRVSSQLLTGMPRWVFWCKQHNELDVTLQGR